MHVYRVNTATGQTSDRPVVTFSPPDPAGAINPPHVLITPDALTYVFVFPRFLSDLYLVEGWK